MRSARLVILLVLILSACGQEKRMLDADQPLTAPTGPRDPRIARYKSNAYEIAQGGRYFAWYGCASCHDAGAPEAFGPGRPRSDEASLDRLYTAIGTHRELSARIPAEQRWQLAAYVAGLTELEPDRRRRQDMDQAAEPQGGSWQGPLL